jgi:hypothetical protein
MEAQRRRAMAEWMYMAGDGAGDWYPHPGMRSRSMGARDPRMDDPHAGGMGFDPRFGARPGFDNSRPSSPGARSPGSRPRSPRFSPHSRHSGDPDIVYGDWEVEESDDEKG